MLGQKPSSKMASTAPVSDAAVGSTTGHDIGEWGPDLDQEDLDMLQQAREDPHAIVEERPRGPQRLGYFSVLCLIFNRMIGM